MARETAAQKLAKRNAAMGGKPPAGDPPPPPADPPAKATAPPTTTLYRVFVLDTVTVGRPGIEGDAPEVPVWVPLPGDEGTPGEVRAASYTAAMDGALEQARARRAAVPVPEGEQAPTAIRLTVAAIGTRNWNQGTALVELRPVTTWEKS